MPSRWIDPASVPDWAVPEELQDGPVADIGSVVVVPLPGHGLPAGAIILLRRSTETAFTQEEEAFARLFAARAGAALSAARLYAEQAHITEVLMRDLLPPPLERVRGIDFSGRYRASASSDRIGGDFYDVHPAGHEDGETFAVLGDVCGKGLEAAVLTGKIRNTLQARCRSPTTTPACCRCSTAPCCPRTTLASPRWRSRRLPASVTSSGSA
ncbi:PP2C family protein-serine/threonine phosphatase [Streptomyces sp. KL116D]|uniref:PP2C family protein-serine/threonine phosphatase n=1 Tax=Streptomyces sp. KL116D TaxID=3045152 RepID=UPI003558AEB7